MTNRKTPRNPSRKATARVKDRLPIPLMCPHCHAVVRITHHHELYGRVYSTWPWLYRCTNERCDSSVGMHPGTALPLGTLADRVTRQARQEHKQAFIQLVRTAFDGDRRAAYAWLAAALGIEPSSCHWGMFDAEQCRRAGALCRVKLADHSEVIG